MKESITPIGTPVGIDVHKRRCKVAEFNQGKIKMRKPMANTREDWLEMLSELPPDAVLVAESGINNPADYARLHAAGFRAFLIGESFMRQPDPGDALAHWIASAMRHTASSTLPS